MAKNPSVAHNQTAEVTIKLNGSMIRGEESTENMYASIDLVADKIERQLRKYKTRYYQKGAKAKGHNGHESQELEIQFDNGTASDNKHSEDSFRPKVVRSKKFMLKPMSAEEACKQMDLLGHDFFMFINDETDQVNTVYHRRDSNYGLIEPES